MPLNGLFDLLLLDADISLRHGGGTVLQELLYQSNIVVAILVDLRGIEFSEAVGADTCVAQVITDQL